MSDPANAGGADKGAAENASLEATRDVFRLEEAHGGPAQHTEDQHDAHDAVQMGPVTRLFISRPRIVACSTFCVPILLLAVLGAVIAADGITFALVDAYKIESNIDIQRDDAIELARKDAFTGESDDDDDDGDDELEREFVTDSVTILYGDIRGGNMLTADNIAKVVRVERAVLSASWEANCQLAYDEDEENSRCASPITILNYVYRDDDKHKEQCEDGFCRIPELVSYCAQNGTWGVYPCVSTVWDWRDAKLLPSKDWPEAVKKRLCDENEVDLRYILGKDRTCNGDELESKLARSTYFLGGPLAGYASREDRPGEQVFARSSIGGGTYGDDLKAAVNPAVDEVSATPSGSRTVAAQPSGDRNINVLYQNFATLAIFDILTNDISLALLSIVVVVAYIWTNVGSLFLTVAGMFQILISLPLGVFGWRVILQQRALEPMLQVLPIYLILCIGADDIFVLVDAFKASASKATYISGSVETRFVWAYHKAASAMFTTTATTVLCLLTTAAASVPAVSAFGILASFVVFFNFLLVITWFPAALLVYTIYIEGKCPRLCALGPCCLVENVHQGTEQTKERASTVFLRERAAPIFLKHRAVFIGVALACGVAMTGALIGTFDIAPGVPTGTPPEHPNNIFEDIQRNDFMNIDDWKLQMSIVYGLDADGPVAYEQDGQVFTSVDRNRMLQFAAFDLDESLQEAIVKDCDELESRQDAGNRLVHDDEVYCLLNDLKEWRPSDFPYKDERKLRAALDDFYDSSHYSSLTSEFDDYAKNTGFVPDGKNGVKALWNTFNTTIPVQTTSGPTALQPFYAAWEAASSEVCASQCFPILPLVVSRRANYYIYAILVELVNIAVQSIGVSVLCAYVVLILTTKNVIVSTFVIVTIFLTIICVVGSVFASGYSLGMYEKTAEAISSIGVSVIGGATTTVMAGLPLFGCVLTLLFLFGYFLFWTSFWAVIMTFFLLVPVLMSIGPEGDSGSLASFGRCLAGCRK